MASTSPASARRTASVTASPAIFPACSGSRQRERHVFPAPCSLLPAPYEGEIRLKRTEGERLVDHLRPDPPRIAERDRESGTAARTGRRRTWCDAASRDGA